MKKTPWLWIVAYVAAFAVFIAGTLVWIRRDDGPTKAATATAAELPPLVAQPFAVSVSPPPPRVPLGMSVPMGASVLHSQAEAVELYDGGHLMDRQSVGERGMASITWPALAIGPHLLTVRAVDGDGTAATAPPVAVDVLANPTEPAPTPITPLTDDETPEQAASRLGLDPVKVMKEGNTMVAHLQGDEKVVPVSAIQSADGEGPSVKATVEDCAATVTVEDAPDGTVIGHATAGTPGFRQLKPTGANTFGPITLNGGAHLFSAKIGDAITAPVGVDVPLECSGAGQWQGDANIVDGVLTLPSASSAFYLYLGVDDKPFVRVPADDSAMLSGASQRVNIADLLPALDGTTLNLEVWRLADNGGPEKWAGGTATIPKGSTIADLIGEPSAIDLTVATPAGPARAFTPADDQKLTFNWTAASSRVERVLFQVLAQPLSTDNRTLDPPMLLAGGLSEASADGTGTFSFDSLSIPRADKPTDDTKGATAAVVSMPSLSTLTTGAAPLTATPFAVPGLIDPTSTASVDQDIASMGPAARGQVWVRVIPMTGLTPLGPASTNVTITLPLDQSDSIRLSYEGALLDVGAAPNPDLAACVRVTTPWTTAPGMGSADPAQTAAIDATMAPGLANATFLSRFYATSGTYCPGDWPQKTSCGVFCYIVKGVTYVFDKLSQVWDFIANAYNKVIDTVVDILAKLNPLCMVAGAVDKGAGATCEDISKVVAHVAIAAVLAAYGIPPSLPTSDAVVAIAKGEVEVLVVELMKQYGAPCDELAEYSEAGPAVSAFAEEAGVPDPTVDGKLDPCLAMARVLVNKISGEVRSAAEVQVAAAGGLPYVSGIPGFEMVPEPRGQVNPSKVEVVATLDQADPNVETPWTTVFRSCAVTASPTPNYPSPFMATTGMLTRDWTPDGTAPNGKKRWRSTFLMSVLNENGLPPAAVVSGMGAQVSFSAGPCLNLAPYGPPPVVAGDSYSAPQSRPGF